MLKIVHFINSYDSSNEETLAFLSVLQNKSDNLEVIICINDDADKSHSEECLKYFSKAVIVISCNELMSSCLFNDEDIIMPVFAGEFFSLDDVQRAVSASEDFTACVIDPSISTTHQINLTKRKGAFVRFSDKLCLIKFSYLVKNIFADLDFSCPGEIRALLLAGVCLKTNELTVIDAQSSINLATPNPQDLSWYSENFFQRYENLGKYCLEKYGQVPYFIQYLIGYQLLRRFTLNRSRNCVCAEIFGYLYAHSKPFIRKQFLRSSRKVRKRFL